MSTNFESAFNLAQLAHPLLKASGDGIVIFNSSVSGGPTAMSSGSLYAATKVVGSQRVARGWCGGGAVVGERKGGKEQLGGRVRRRCERACALQRSAAQGSAAQG